MKQKSKSLRTSDLRYENILGTELMPKGVMFQCYFPLVVFTADLGPASGLILIQWYIE